MTRPDTLLVGCGRLGSAISAGWRASSAVAPARLAIQTPSSQPEAEAARAAGATLNPSDLSGAARVVLAVKPAVWREAAAELAPRLPQGAVIVSVMAGVRAADLSRAFGGRRVARVMPTTAVAAGLGVAAIWSEDEAARAVAHALFDPMATTVDLDDEALMDAATAVSGSGTAYFYAFVEAMTRAGEAQGLPPEAAAALARATGASSLTWMMQGRHDPAALIAQVASPGGTTRAALDVLDGEGALTRLVGEAVDAAVRRARELGGA